MSSSLLPRPVGIAQFLRSEKNYAAALTLALAHELLPLLVGRDPEQSKRARVGHRALQRASCRKTGLREYHALGKRGENQIIESFQEKFVVYT